MIHSNLKATDSLEAWLSYLETSHVKTIDMGLTRIRNVASELDLLQPAPYVITVAGTNGKGSTCRLLEAILMKSGFKVGVYSSPHLLRYNERVRIQGEVLADHYYTAAFCFIDQNRTESLTYFEFSTLSALRLFKQAHVDIAILEVGLGGRLDATNIVDANIAVITSIDIDHTEFLGNNREDIGREKAGIFRKNSCAIIGEADCPRSVIEYANALNCRLFRRGIDWNFTCDCQHWLWQSQGKQLADLPLPKIPLANVATVLATVEQLPFQIDEPILREAIAETQLAGRFQQLNSEAFSAFSGIKPNATVIVDVGHNPHAARYLAEKISPLKTGKVYAVFSALADKDLKGIVGPLSNSVDKWFCAGLNIARGQSGEAVAKQVKSCLPNAEVETYTNIAMAAEAAFVQAEMPDIILVFGSFYTVSDFLQYIAQ